MDPTARAGAVRGAAVALAAAGATAAAVGLTMRESLLHVVGPPPVPRVFAGFAVAVAAIAGALTGSRVARCAAPPRPRRARALRGAGLAYLAAVGGVAAALRVATLGVETLAVPAQVLLGGLLACVLFLPWAAVPVLAAALALEAWTRPRRRGHV